MNMLKTYELHPTQNQKSFYGKAIVKVDENGTETLYSYETPIISKNKDGKLTRLWFDYTPTTGKHIKAFCGLNKAEFENL